MYTVLSASGKNAENIIALVNQHLKDGWKCTGGIYIIPIIGATNNYYQAMVKDLK